MSGTSRLEGAAAAKANTLLRKVSALFGRHGIRFCIDGGTLLGIVREGRLLPWDNDLDFFVPADQAPHILKLRWHLLLLGCKLKCSDVLETTGPMPKGGARIYKIKLLRRIDGQRIVIDLIFKYPDATHFHWLVGSNPHVHKKVARRFYDTLETISYEGATLPVPSDVESYLTERYGDWRTPKKEWNFKTDDHAIV